MKWTTVATVLAFLAIPTIASAHAGNNDPNMVHACIGNVSKIVRIVGVSGSCLTAPPLLAETPAHWPQVQGTGSQGPKGDQGDPGTPGTNGTNGTNGTDGTNGAPGTNGTDGIDGTNGTNGTNGIDGTNGTRADAPCFHNTNRYVNCGNGTVTDTVTGLIWLQQADCLANANYSAANQAAAALANLQCGLTDGSSPGDWRLPTKDEWNVTIARARALGCIAGSAPSLTKDAGTTCFGNGTGSSFAGVTSEYYWSSTTDETYPAWAGVAFLLGGNVGGGFKDGALRVWPVRGGPR